MKYQDYEYLVDFCEISVTEANTMAFTPRSVEEAEHIQEVIKNNKLENLPIAAFIELTQQHHPMYQARRKLEQQKLEKYAALTPEKIAGLPLEQKLDYMELLFPKKQTVGELMETVPKHMQNIRACLFNMDFPKSFWEDEKKKADHYASLIANSPDITDKLRAWPETTLDEKKDIIKKSAKVFEYVYGVSPEIVFFTPEEEKAKQWAQGLNEDAHINAAYYQQGKIYFNEERLQNSDNLFGMSVLFHEGTHYRQHHQSFNNPVVDRMFKSCINNVTTYENEVSHPEDIDYKDLYAMQPAEVHAHGVQEYMENKLTEMTGIDKTAVVESDKTVKRIHNKAFSMAKLSQYRSE